MSRAGAQSRLTVTVALLSMVGPFSIDAYLPSFPDIEASFGISRAMLSQSLAVYLMAFAVSTLIWGPLSDRVGRRLVVMVGLSLYVLASAGCAMAESSTAFMTLRVLQGFAASGGFIAGRAMIRDAHDAVDAHRAMSQVMLLFALAPAIAPVLGAWLHDTFGWRSVFWFLGILGALLVLMMGFIEETLPVMHRQSIHPLSVIRIYVRTLKHRQFPMMVMSLALSFAGMFLYIAGAPTVIYDFIGLGSDDFGVQFIPMVAGVMCGSYVSGRLSHHWPAERIIAAGFGIMMLAVIANLAQAAIFEPTILSTISPLVIYTFGIAMIMPAITILALDCFPNHRGTAASMQGFAQMMVNAGVASLAVPLLHARYEYFVMGQAVFMTVSLALWYFSIRQKR